MTDEPSPPADLTGSGAIAQGSDARAVGERGVMVEGANTGIINTGVLTLVQGLGDLPTRFDSNIRNFLTYYVGTDEAPAPFGGRDADLHGLDAWFSQAHPPYAFLNAPAGRGKSALLAHWALAQQARDRAHVVFFPVSIRYGTNRENVAFAALAARMASIFGERAGRANDAQEYRGIFNDYLSRTPPDGKPVLIVLDALDEAAGWEADAALFPDPVPPHLRAIVSAAARANDSQGLNWLMQLGWERSNACLMQLGGLDVEGVRDVLRKMGNPLAALAPRFDIVRRLHTLSLGDPLLVRLYVEALLPQGERAAAFTADDLLLLQPGLQPFLDRWFEEQQTLWAGDVRFSAAARDRAVNGLLSACALAKGPLSREDVLWVAEPEVPDTPTLAWATDALSRFIVGDGSTQNGYVFSHPRLADYFAERLTRGERDGWRARYLRYGRETLLALNEGALKPADASPYIVRYYGAHLGDTNAPAADLYALMSEGWLRAWEWADGTPDGFLGDCDRGWARAEAEGGAVLAHVARAALCHASVASLGANTPDELLATCVCGGVMSFALALVLARTNPNLQERAEALAALSAHAGDRQAEVLAEALRAAGAIQDERQLASALSAVAVRLPLHQQAELLAQALAAAQAIPDAGDRASALSAVAERLPSDQRAGVLAQALAAAQAIPHEWRRAEALSAVAERLPSDQPELLARALAAAQAIPDAGWRAYALRAVVVRLPPDQPELLAQALAAAQAIPDAGDRAAALSAVAVWLPSDQQAELLAQALAAAQAIPDEWSRAAALSAVAVRLPPDQPELLAQALAAAQAIADAEDRASALSAVAVRLPLDQQAELLAQALAAAQAIPDAGDRASALSAVAERLPSDQRAGVLAQALAAAQAIPDEWSRANALSAVAERLPSDQPELLAQALAAAQAIADAEDRASALSAVAERLPPDQQAELLAQALAAAQAIPDAGDRTAALSAVAVWLPPDQQAEVLAQALAAAQAIPDEWSRADALSAVAVRLPPNQQTEVLAQALAAAQAIADAGDRALALSAVAERLPSDQPELLAQALAAAQVIADAGDRASALSAVAERLPPDQPELLAQALAAAQAIPDEWWRADALSAVAVRLPPDQQAEVLAQALAAAQAIPYEWSRADALRAVVERLPPDQQAELLAQALAAAQAIPHERHRAAALSALAVWLPPDQQAELLAQALAAAQAIADAEERAGALRAVAVWLPSDQPELLAQTLAAAQAIPHEWRRAYVLSAVAARLPPDQPGLLAQAWQAVVSVAHLQGQSALAAFVKGWPGLSAAAGKTEARLLSETLRAFSRGGRPQCLQALVALLPIFDRLGGPPALEGVAQAITDTAKWWP